MELVPGTYTGSRAFEEHPVKPVKMQMDASKSGLEACILQDGHPIAYASRSLIQAEEHYAQIEKEFLAVVFGCKSFNHYVYGRPVDVMSDHKPLSSITKKPLVSSSPRLQHLLLRLQKHEVNITYVPGKHMHVADTLSIAYLNEQPPGADLTNDMEVMVHSLIANLPMTQEKLAQMKSATAQDEDLQMLSKIVKDGCPSIEGNCLFQWPITGILIFVVRFMKQKVCSSLARGSLSHKR